MGLSGGVPGITAILNFNRALVFFTTATHAAFYDHTIVFESEGQVRALLAHHGFEILEEKVLLVMEGPEGKNLKDVSVVAFLSPQADGGNSS